MSAAAARGPGPLPQRRGWLGAGEARRAGAVGTQVQLGLRLPLLEPAIDVAVALGLVDELRVRGLARLLADLDEDLLLVHLPSASARRRGSAASARSGATCG